MPPDIGTADAFAACWWLKKGNKAEDLVRVRTYDTDNGNGPLPDPRLQVTDAQTREAKR